MKNETIRIRIQPYHRIGNNAPAMTATELGRESEAVSGRGKPEKPHDVDRLIDELLLAWARRHVEVEVEVAEGLAVRSLPTDPEGLVER